MKKSKVETAETRRRIVGVAARRFRVNGIHATGLNDLMSEAGLTRGGFYRHFESKDQLVAEAFTEGITALITSLEGAAARSEGKHAFSTIVGRYVSANHRDDPFGGCPLAAMGSELARADEATRTAASAGLGALVEMLEKRLSSEEPETSHAEAVFALAAMIGAVTMSRVLVDRDASARVLRYVKQQLDTL